MSHTEQQLILLKQSSHSSSETLATCPRRYELDKLLAGKLETSATFEFGKAVGAGAQKLLECPEDLDAAIWEVFKFWTMDLDDDSEAAKKKTFWHACAAVDSFRMVQRGPLAKWKLMWFNGKPATELSFRIDLGDGFFYRGYLDAALQHEEDGTLGVFECKSTGLRDPKEVQYKNSNQGVGYSLILDVISEQLGIPEGPRYSVFYPVYSSTDMSWNVFPFAKTYALRADFLHSILMDKKVVSLYLDSGKFPKRGSGCYNFFRQCEHYELCDMSNRVLLMTQANRQVDPKDLVDSKKYDFEFTFDQLIESQMRRISNHA